MRKGLSWLLVFLGAFLLVIGLLVRFYAVGELKRTPLSVDSTTRLEGTAAKLNASTGDVDDLDVKVTALTKSDDEASDDKVIVFATTTCVVVDEPDVPECIGDEDDDRLITNSTDIFATDRVTAESTNEGDYLPSGDVDVEGNAVEVVPHEGLVNKWPFDAKQDGYPFWDGVLQRSVDATYQGEEEIDGLNTYVYNVSVENEPATVVGDIEGLYSVDKTINVEPKTGSIIKQTQHDVRTQENGDPLIDLQVAYTDDTVSEAVEDAKSAKSQLGLVSTTIPLVGVLLGLVLLVLGLVMVRRASRED